MKMRPEVSYEGIGLSLPGRVDLTSQRLVFAPNLGWSDIDLKTPLEAVTGLSVELENAANACALAEVWFGHLPEAGNNLIALTVSEGIGSGLILNNQLVRGSTGMAGEFGHMTIVENGIECRCGNLGCWEVYASNSAAVRYYTQSALSFRQSKEPKAGGRLAGQAPTFDDILRLAAQGDIKAIEAINQMAHYLGAGIALLVTGLAPDTIIVVGDVTRIWDRVGPVIANVVENRSFNRATTRIIPADPTAQPRLLGTIALVLQRHFGAPLVA
jgi:predicted NBD/HSP70 family sugar kinase